MVRIIIEHNNGDNWNSFYAEVKDRDRPYGHTIRASASGDWKFISMVVADWLSRTDWE